MKARILSIDAWHDGEGWQWNNWFTIQETIDVPDNATNRQILKLARDEYGILNDASKGKVGIDDDGHNIVILNKNTREPLFAFCYGEYWEENGL